MRIAVITGLLAFASILIVPSVSALDVSNNTNDSSGSKGALLLSADLAENVNAVQAKTSSDAVKVLTASTSSNTDKQPAKVETKPAEVIVQQGDTLTKIAESNNTTWRAIFDKNLDIKDPNLLNVGQKITLPQQNENLQPRPLPEAAVVESPSQGATNVATSPSSSSSAPKTSTPAATPKATAGSSAGNLYTEGNCTWYVKNRRPDLPNNLGNAATWVARAAAQGLATGSSPKAGAVGQRGNHVVYVESVNSDGTVTISEMNHVGLWVTTVRTLPASYFSYIY